MIPNLPTIGVRFDIERVGGGYYGLGCWKIFWQAINPREIGAAFLYEGDTAASLNNRENVFCIAVQSLDPGAVERISAALQRSEKFKQVCADPMFVEGPSCAAEPLPAAGRIDAEGRLVSEAGACRSALETVERERAAQPRPAATAPLTAPAPPQTEGVRAYLMLLWDSVPWTEEQVRQIEQAKGAELGIPATVLTSLRVTGTMPTQVDDHVISTALQACQQAGIPVVAGRDSITYTGGTNAAGQGLGLITVVVHPAPAAARTPSAPAPGTTGHPPQGFQPPAAASLAPAKSHSWPLIASIGIVVVALIVAGVFFIPRILKGSPASAQVRLATGYGSTCFISSSGGVKCWGTNGNGQLGNGSTSDSSVPVEVMGLSSNVTAITARGDYPSIDHVCALTAAGGVRCWGSNDEGQLGNQTTTDSRVPVEVTGLSSGVSALSAGEDHTCALMTAGGVKCWGNNSWGQLGNENAADGGTPVDVTGLSSKVAAIAAGDDHTCALMSTGGVRCWGYNGYGQLGNGTTSGTSDVPVDVVGLTSGVSALAAGGNHTCALMTAGGVKCWGHNDEGQLGNGTVTDSSVPVDVTGLSSGAAAVSAGGWYSCALLTGGGLKCWGWNLYGELGNGTSTGSRTPVDVTGLSSGVAAVSAGGHHACALLIAGGLKCWGYNDFGQLGNGTTTDSTVPVDVTIS